jgi:phage N-6-adenine-methyltransferase
MTEQQGRNLGGSNFSKTDPLHKDYWATPQEMVDGLLRYAVVKEIVPEGLPLLDVCASEQNKKCERFITEQQDTLATPWGDNNLCWLNPPYSNVQPFLNKAVAEAANGNYTVALLKNDCSTKWFHYAAKNAIAVVYIMLGRIGFVSALSGESVGGNNFSSVAFIFGPGRKGLRSLYVTKQKLGELANGKTN